MIDKKFPIVECEWSDAFTISSCNVQNAVEEPPKIVKSYGRLLNYPKADFILICTHDAGLS